MDMDWVTSHELQNDDVFYAELERQILLLTADDDGDDFLDSAKYSKSMRVMKKWSSNVGPTSGIVTQPGSYFDWTENEKSTNLVPTSILNVWRNGNGTGVFIPYIVKYRRRNYKPRKKNDKERIYKPVANKKG